MLLSYHTPRNLSIRPEELSLFCIYCYNPVTFTTKNTSCSAGVFLGGEDATRTHNALRHTTFPMWLLTIRIPLHLFTFPPPHQRRVLLYRRRQKKSRGNFAKKALLLFCTKQIHNSLSQSFQPLSRGKIIMPPGAVSGYAKHPVQHPALKQRLGLPHL